ncbi:MAG: ATP-binding protein [Clostridia bacterium]|nr:ATP-binding protein [Clostridia bacterium]
MFVDRITELNTLTRIYRQSHSCMVVVHGRRRRGKTSLLREFVRNKPAVYYVASRENAEANKAAFRRTVADVAGSPLLRDAVIRRWEPLLALPATLCLGRKPVLVLDEAENLGLADPDFFSVLRYVWDTVLAPANIMVILCGSDVRALRELTLSESSPLCGVVHAEMALDPIPFRKFGSFYPGTETHELLSLYSITGGIPLYARRFQPNMPLAAMIARHILEPSSFLYSEPESLLRSELAEEEFRDLLPVLAAAAAGPGDLKSIAARLRQPPGQTLAFLEDLMEADLIQCLHPLRAESLADSGSALYEVKDGFLRFWLRYIYPHRSVLEFGRSEMVLSQIMDDFHRGHLQPVYEEMCRQETRELGEAGIWPEMQQVSPLQDGGRISLAGLSEDAALFGSCRISPQRADRHTLESLQEAADQIPLPDPSMGRYYALFSSGGFSADLEALADSDPHILLSH